MKIGVPKEIKTHEYRVGLIPHAVAELCRDGHNVVIERGAGVGAGFADVEYESVGAELADSAEAVFEAADLDGDGPGGHLTALACLARCGGSTRCAVRSVLFGLALRVRRRVTGPVAHSGSKMSYAAVASFPVSSFVLEAR